MPATKAKKPQKEKRKPGRPPNKKASKGSKVQKVAQMVADDIINDVGIAERGGIAPRTLARWKHDPEFQRKVDEIRNESKAFFHYDAVRNRESRIKNLQDRLARMQHMMDQRGAHLADEFPGADTGLYAKDYKGRNADQPIFRFDDKLEKAMRETERQLAIELNEWNEQGPVDAGDTSGITKALDFIKQLYDDSKQGD